MNPIKWVVVILAVVGLLAIVAAVIYYSVPADSLPSFLGTLHHIKAHRRERGRDALVLGVVLLILAAIVGLVGRSRNVSQGSAQQQVI
jgi:amino acid permease